MKNKKVCPKPNQRVLVAMSGGVDSSSSAWLLKKQGFEVVGVFLNLGQVQYKESLAAARKVAQKIGMPLKVIDLKKKFRKEVIDYFLKSYQQGLTPNPCVVCNQKIKFNTLLELAKKLGFDYIATGHYARLYSSVIARRIRPLSGDDEVMPEADPPLADNPEHQRDCHAPLRGARNDILCLLQARDLKKDQSYFLYNLAQAQLAKILFPLGDYTKKEARKLADKEKLPYLKKESQDICFLFCETSEFLKQNLKLKPGPIVTTAGKLIGRHEGLPLYTLGQRRAVKIGGSGPFYVAIKDWRKNELIVTNHANDPILYSDKLLAGQVNWLAGEIPKLPLKCRARVRYQQPLIDCLVNRKGKNYLVKLSQKLRAITPGQSVVFYRDGTVLGGGVIKNKK